MSFLESIRQKAPFLDKLAESFTPSMTRDEQFRAEYKLPAEEHIIDDTSADVSFISAFGHAKTLRDKGRKGEQAMAYVFSGKFFLTPHYLVFRDAFDHASCVMIVNLSTVKRVERAPSTAYAFSLIVTLYSGTQILIQFIGLRYRSEQFCDHLKKKLKENIPNAKQLPDFLSSCYSEFLLRKNLLNAKDIAAPSAGLGQQFKFPGNPTVAKEKARLMLWFNYFKENGENLAIVKNHEFQKLIRIGVPNRMRGEIWELCSGSMYLRQANPGVYQKILKDNASKVSQAVEEIEKDLKRSLPEYSAYQTEEGIQRLRNVLTAYSWKNPDVGYCQAMNIVVAGLLIFMTEEQAFWCLSSLCDTYVPGYYSKTMYGTLLDQKVFEAFVEEKMPLLWNHIVENDIQLSVVSLPWFLSLFFTSMPLEYAFRIMDIFFMNGSQTLFQVALAILKLNGDDLFQSEDDGMFIAILKNYFQTLSQSAHPDSSDVKYRQITKFQELLVTAFKEFSVIENSMVAQERARHQKGILQNIETFVKRTQLRHMPRTLNLTEEELSNIYDIFYQSIENHKISMGTGSSNMNFEVFIQFLSKFCDWCRSSENDNDPAFRQQRRNFLKRLFKNWDSGNVGDLTLNDVVSGLDKLLSRDLLESVNYFFSLYDEDGDGELQREEVLQISEGLLFLTEPWKTSRFVDILTKQSIEADIAEKIVKEKGTAMTMDELKLPSGVTIDEEKYKTEQTERYLKAASCFLQRSFEYARPLEVAEEINLIDLSDNEGETEDAKQKKFQSMRANAALDPSHPTVIDLATFRMIILADETYELFFTITFRHSIHVDQRVDLSEAKDKALRSMFDGIIADGRRVADQVRRRVDSVATRSTTASINSITASNGPATIPRDDKSDDLDDLTSYHADEHEELLNNSWLGDVESSDSSKKQSRTLQPINSSSGSQQEDLIEFET